MGGLALCSANEAKFNAEGFLFALSTNLSEWWELLIYQGLTTGIQRQFSLQNVLSKRMLNFNKTKYNPGEIQYFTALASILAQVPLLILFSTSQGWSDLIDPGRGLLYLFNGICFHFQTLSGYALMEAISPVTHSVANTLKRALLIWLSVIIFKNTITLFSGIGTTIVSRLSILKCCS